VLNVTPRPTNGLSSACACRLPGTAGPASESGRPLQPSPRYPDRGFLAEMAKPMADKASDIYPGLLEEFPNSKAAEIYPGLLDQFLENSLDLPAPTEPSLSSSDYRLKEQHSSQQSSISSHDYIPQLRLDMYPSRGSEAHSEDKCQPCCFFLRGKCMVGQGCLYCHYPHQRQQRPGKKSRERAKRRQSQNDTGESGDLDDDDCAGQQGLVTASDGTQMLLQMGSAANAQHVSNSSQQARPSTAYAGIGAGSHEKLPQKVATKLAL